MDEPFSLKKKKVLHVCLGLHGGGASVLRYLLKKGAYVRVTDAKTRKELFSTLKQFIGVHGTFGKNDPKDVAWADIIVKNPGVPTDHALLRLARAKRKPIVSDVSLFQSTIAKKFDCVVTGTRGKTTTASLIGYMLRGRFSKVFVGGNNRVPVLSAVDTAKKSKVILELSSFQIEDTNPRSHIAVFTTFFPDHLNRYKSLKFYFEAKAKLFFQQDKSDVAVLNYDDQHIRGLSKHIKSQIYFFSLHKLPSKVCGAYVYKKFFYIQDGGKIKRVARIEDVKLFGLHNFQNMCAAICVSYALNLPLSLIRRRLCLFQGVKYRLQEIRRLQGRIFFNDTTATSPDALLAAYRTLRERFPSSTLRILVGGADKKLDYSIFKKMHADHLVRIYPLKGTATSRLLRSIPFEHTSVYTSLQAAVACAWKESSPKDIIALSPGAASFGMFMHEFDRGEQFNVLVKKLR
jgi:UDP-N-acetylmuramoylalanine--D-glutamate ligase